MGEHISLTAEEIEQEDYENAIQADQNENISMTKAAKLNRFKFAQHIPEMDKISYFNGFLETLYLYNYYFWSDSLSGEPSRKNYIGKVVSIQEEILIPYAINWREDLQNYIVWGFCLKPLTEIKSVIEIKSMIITNLEEIAITNQDAYSYLFLQGASCLDSQVSN